MMYERDEEQARYQNDYTRMVKTSDYTLRYLASHLYEAHEHEKLYTLLVGSSAWMEAKFTRLVDDSAYVEELDLALRTFMDPLSATQLRTLFQLWTAHQIVHDRVNVFTDEDLRILVLLGRNAEAAAAARLRSETSERAIGLLAVYAAIQQQGIQSPDLLDELFKEAHRMEDDQRASLLRDLALILYRVNHPQLRQVIADAAWAINALDDEYQRKSLKYDLALLLAALGEFDQAVATTRDLDEEMSEMKLPDDILVAIAAGKRETAVALARDETQKRIEAELNPDRRDDFAPDILALCDQMFKLGAGVSDELLNAGLALVHEFPNARERVPALRVLTVTLAKIGHQRAGMVFNELVAEARTMPSTNYLRWRSLREDIARMLIEAEKFEQAFTIIRGLETSYSRFPALCSLASVVNDEQIRQAAVDELMTLSANTSSDLAELARVLNRIGDHRAHEIADLALKRAQAAGYLYTRATYLAHLALALMEAKDPRSSEIFERAVEAARAFKQDHEPVSALAEVGRIFAKIDPVRARALLDEGLQVTRRARFRRAFDRVAGLGDIAAALAEMDFRSRADEIFADALALAHDIREDDDWANAISLLVTQLALADRVTEACKAAESLTGLSQRDSVRVELASALAKTGSIQDALAEVTGIADSSNRATAMREIAPVIVQQNGWIKMLAELGPYQVSDFIHIILGCLDLFEAMQPSLSLSIVKDAARIASWLDYKWRDLYTPIPFTETAHTD